MHKEICEVKTFMYEIGTQFLNVSVYSRGSCEVSRILRIMLDMHCL